MKQKITENDYYELHTKYVELVHAVIKKINCSGVAMQDYKCLRHDRVQPACPSYKLCCMVLPLKEVYPND